MSGGSYNYAFTGVNDFMWEMNQRDFPTSASREHRKALAELLGVVSEAMRAVEWEDSGDTGPEQTIKAIEDCFEFARDKVLPK